MWCDKPENSNTLSGTIDLRNANPSGFCLREILRHEILTSLRLSRKKGKIEIGGRTTIPAAETLLSGTQVRVHTNLVVIADDIVLKSRPITSLAFAGTKILLISLFNGHREKMTKLP